MRVRRMIVTLDPIAYQRLAAIAEREKREPPQQAAYELSRLLSDRASEQDREAVHA